MTGRKKKEMDERQQIIKNFRFGSKIRILYFLLLLVSQYNSVTFANLIKLKTRSNEKR